LHHGLLELSEGGVMELGLMNPDRFSLVELMST